MLCEMVCLWSTWMMPLPRYISEGLAQLERLSFEWYYLNERNTALKCHLYNGLAFLFYLRSIVIKSYFSFFQDLGIHPTVKMSAVEYDEHESKFMRKAKENPFVPAGK